MKKTIQIALLALCTLTSSCSTDNVQNSLEEANLKGKVRSVLTIYYNGVDKFGEGQIVKGSPQYFGSSYKTFDTTGFVTNSKSFFISDSYKSSENVYDKDGNHIKWVSYAKDGDTRFCEEYEYDDRGRKKLERDVLDKDVTRYYNTYDNEGRLIKVVSGSETNIYKYNEKGQLVSETETYSFLGSRTIDYFYDDEGKLIQRNRKGYTGTKSYYFYKYDSFDREIASIECDSDDPDNGKVLEKAAFYYIDDYATTPYMIKRWDEDGNLSRTFYRVFFASQKDTLSIVELDEKFCPSWITVQAKKGNNLISTGYDVTSSILNDETYNYIGGRIASSRDDDGNVTSYVYNDNKLVSVVQEISKGKIVSNYKGGKLINKTSYDEDNNTESTHTYTYKGNTANGTVTHTITDKENKVETYVTIYQEGKIIEEVVTRNGLSITSKYNYNVEGDVSFIASSDGTNIEYSYIYDAFGNWFQRTEKNGEDITIVERKIDYYL